MNRMCMFVYIRQPKNKLELFKGPPPQPSYMYYIRSNQIEKDRRVFYQISIGIQNSYA